MKDQTKSKFKTLFYIALLVLAFWAGHKYGSDVANQLPDLNLPSITINTGGDSAS